MNTMQPSPTTERAFYVPHGDDHFDDLADHVRRVFALASGKPLFRVAAPDLFKIYLDNFVPEERQTHNCHACKQFIERYGALVTIDDSGMVTPAMWRGDAPEPYRASIAAMAAAVQRAAVEGVFLSREDEWGIAVTGEWRHFSVKNPRKFAAPLMTAGQAMAAKREEYGMLRRGLAEFPSAIVDKALALLEADALYRSEKVLGAATWLSGLHTRMASTKNKRLQDNMAWLAIATAPAGFAHVRSTMIGTLLEDLAAGVDIDEAKRRFADKMHPLQYRRPTAPPSDANIAQAEKAIAELGAAGALDRRFATLHDIVPLWAPRSPVESKPTGGVFGHLQDKRPEAESLGAAPQAMTWDKFARTVLPAAERMEFYVPHGPAPYLALVTAANPDAPPLLQWDSTEKRNPVSWYMYVQGSPPQMWGLTAGTWCPVTAATLLPPMWQNPERNRHHGEGAILILDGCRDIGHQCGGGMFVESMRSDLHSYRRTLEAHIAQATIAGKEQASACGIDLRKGGRWDVRVRVTSRGMQMEYRLDRWD